MCWVMDRSAQKNDTTEAPPLFDLVSAGFSPLTHVRQCYSAMMDGTWSRLRLIYQGAGCDSFGSWIKDHPVQAASFRRIAQVADGWIFRKFGRPFQCWPWRLAIVGDMRVQHAVRLEVARDFMGPCETCLDPFFGRRLRNKFKPRPEPEDFCNDRFFQTFLLMWARSVMLSIMLIENLHAANKRTMVPGSSLYTFVSKFIVAEFMRLKRAREWIRDVLVGTATGAIAAVSAVTSFASQSELIQHVMSSNRKLAEWEVFAWMRSKEHKASHGQFRHNESGPDAIAWRADMYTQYQRRIADDPALAVRLHNLTRLSGYTAVAYVTRGVKRRLEHSRTSPLALTDRDRPSSAICLKQINKAELALPDISPTSPSRVSVDMVFLGRLPLVTAAAHAAHTNHQL